MLLIVIKLPRLPPPKPKTRVLESGEESSFCNEAQNGTMLLDSSHVSGINQRVEKRLPPPLVIKTYSCGRCHKMSEAVSHFSSGEIAKLQLNKHRFLLDPLVQLFLKTTVRSPGKILLGLGCVFLSLYVYGRAFSRKWRLWWKPGADLMLKPEHVLVASKKQTCIPRNCVFSSVSFLYCTRAEFG
ncbi:hypothetical protein NPIL_72101 [Nephila pilipes]|uniref:Uncharacterized protein n=1 Tax=Nephila pilipes TaxID=299642 RepID=A0A8X6NIP9_NEPPI|nr:hypothetical protein NPIL_72101 [Nephila pilipes]